MAIDQDTIAAEREKLKAEIGELKIQLKVKQTLYAEYNKLSALLGGPAPGNGKRKSPPKITKKCGVRGCSRKDHVFTTQAAFTRHTNHEHGGQ
jgi:hypothetical protein